MIFGIDTSNAAGVKNINWSKARTDGLITFGILRSNWGTAKDAVFEREWARMLAAGLVGGAYMFLRFPGAKAKTVPSPSDQANTMIEVLEDKLVAGRDLPPVLDVEFPGGAATTGMTTAALLDGVREAWTILRDHFGAPPIIYTSGRVWKEDLKNSPAPDLVESPLWLARYPFKAGPAVRDPAKVLKAAAPPVPVPWGDEKSWWIHQYQGDAIGLPGFPVGKVDMNRFQTASPGDTGGHVAWIQRRLVKPIASGKFDKTTETVLRQFQASKGLVVDGIVGPRTFTKLAWS
jgi:GH25 family lysozyme M1 (1,4-beta-N-acetylmuramidase)